MLTIDHSLIAADTLAIARRAAALDPDGQIFPWRDGYPLAGSTVYFDLRLWTVVQNDGDAVLLVGCGHDLETLELAHDLRPVSWTQQNELDLAQRATTTEIPRAQLDSLIASTAPGPGRDHDEIESSLGCAPLFTDPGAR